MRSLSMRTAIVLTLLATVSAGGGWVPPPTAEAGQSTGQSPDGMESHDDLLVRVEQRAPGFGGMFIDRDGALVVYLLDVAQIASARSAIEAVFGPDQVPAAGARAVQGQYTVSQLKTWVDLAEPEVLAVSGVTMVDLDEARNRIAIGVDDDSRTPDVERVVSGLAIPREAIVVAVTGGIRPIR